MQSTQLLICDWILETRTKIWEDYVKRQNAAGIPAPAEMLQGFQYDLGSLRIITNHVAVSFLCLAYFQHAAIFAFALWVFILIIFSQNAMNRVFLYEATMRLMAGANPRSTQILLDRSMRHRGGRGNMICSSGEFIMMEKIQP